VKKIIIFDLDGTLAESKSNIDNEMSELLGYLLESKLVAVVSGGSYHQFEDQLLSNLKVEKYLLRRLHLFPTNATQYHSHNAKWRLVYWELLPRERVHQIREAFTLVTKDFDILWKGSYGEIIEDRGSQVTFSALGQKAPLSLKRLWDPKGCKRHVIVARLQKLLPDLSISIGGTTSIDVTRKGLDKRYCIVKITKLLGLHIREMLFIGDALFEGGNDFSIKAAGVECITTLGIEQTKEIIGSLVKSYREE